MCFMVKLHWSRKRGMWLIYGNREMTSSTSWVVYRWYAGATDAMSTFVGVTCVSVPIVSPR